MRRNLRLLAALVAAALPTGALALDPDTADPRAIMDAMENREVPSSSRFRLGITITDSKGRERTRQVNVRSLQFEGGTKQLLQFEQPADLRNAGLLSIDYDDGATADNQWLYLPSIGKTTRIASADKSGSFMGTDLTYADMTRKDPAAYDYALVKASESVDGEDCWLIGATPRTDKEKQETGYEKSLVWVSKEKLLPVQIKAWMLDGDRFKYTKVADVQKVDGTWVAHRVVVRTLKGSEVESTSTLVTSDLVFGADDVTDADFTEQRLERGL